MDIKVGYPNSSSRILLVDDEPSIRESLADFLADAGYQVYQEADGYGAFELYRENCPFLFVLTDFQFIPGQQVSSCGIKIRHGADLVREIRKLVPQQRMAIMTGDHHVAQAALDASVKDVTLLKKPLRLKELSKLIERP